MMDEKEIALFMDEFYGISNRMTQIRNTSLVFEGGIAVNSAGLSFLDAVAGNEGMNMAELGERLGLTKGAVSQMAGKLEGKGLLKKERSKRGGREVYLELTAEGIRIREEYMVLRRRMYEGVVDIAGSYSGEEIQTIRRFLRQIGEFAQNYQKKFLVSQKESAEDERGLLRDRSGSQGGELQ